MKRIALLLIGGMLLGLQMQAQEFSAYVDKNTVALNETFQLSFRLDDAQSQDISYPNLSQFQVLSGPNLSQSFQSSFGKVTRSITFSFALRPKKKGKFTIGKGSIKVDGKTLSSKPLTVTVGDAKAQAQGNTRQGGKQSGNSMSAEERQSIDNQIKERVFVRAFPTKSTVYQGEQIGITYKLYANLDFTARDIDPPAFGGFWKEEIELKGQRPEIEVIEGKRFRVWQIYKSILIPQRTGKIKIDPLTYTISVALRVPARSFFDILESNRNYEYKVRARALNLTVKPLPAQGRPADFSGAVGKFTLDASLDKEATETGDPITYSITLKGTGNIQSLAEPRLDFPADFDVYDPKLSDRISRNGGVLGGSRTYDYLIVPRNPGDYKLPPVTFSYFDLAKNRYVTLKAPEYSVNVTGEAQDDGSAPLLTTKEDLELIGEDIRHIRVSSGSFGKIGSSFLGSGGFYALYLLPILAFVALFMMQRRNAEMAADVAGTRRRKASKLVTKRLAEAQAKLKDNDERGFYKALSEAMWKYLGDKLTLNPSELSRERVAADLQSRGVAQENIDAALTLIEDCEMALFAPSQGAGGMEQRFQQASSLINDLEKSIA